MPCCFVARAAHLDDSVLQEHEVLPPSGRDAEDDVVQHVVSGAHDDGAAVLEVGGKGVSPPENDVLSVAHLFQGLADAASAHDDNGLHLDLPGGGALAEALWLLLLNSSSRLLSGHLLLLLFGRWRGRLCFLRSCFRLGFFLLWLLLGELEDGRPVVRVGLPRHAVQVLPGPRSHSPLWT